MKRYVRRCPPQRWLPATALLVAALIAGCGTSPPGQGTTHYLLTDITTMSEPTGGQRLLRVKRIELARYLNVEGIVMQTSDIAVRAARNHLWAEDLGAQLHRDLRRRLAEELDGVRVLGPEQRPPAAERAFMELTVTVDRFQGRFDGYAVVSGKWQLLDRQGEVHAGKRFHFEQALARDGYPALVNSLNDAWTRVVAAIADEVPGAWPEDGHAD